MIREIGKEIEAALRELGCHFEVVAGPEPTKTNTGARERIVLEHDMDAGDTFSPVRGSTRNRNPAPVSRIVNQGFKATIYAKAPNAGSNHWEHRRRAEHVRDMFIAVLDDVSSVRFNDWDPKSGRFVETEDGEGSPVIMGATYELRFTFERGLRKEDWNREAAEEKTITDGFIRNTTEVGYANAPDDAESVIGCGA